MAVVSNQRVRLKLVERPTLRCRVLPRFPSTVEGENGIEVARENGGYIVRPKWDELILIETLDEPEDKQVWVRDPVTGDYWRVSIQAIVDEVLALGSRNPTVITGSSHTVADEGYIVVQRSSPATNCAITLPAVADRNGKSLIVSDWSTGIGGSGHSIVFTPNGSQKIQGQSTWTLFSSGDNYRGSVTLKPSTTLSGWDVV